MRAHIFLQSVNVIRNIDYLTRCIKTEAQSGRLGIPSTMGHQDAHPFSNVGCVTNALAREAVNAIGYLAACDVSHAVGHVVASGLRFQNHKIGCKEESARIE